MTDFERFQKIPRWSRSVVVTEKIDGTNAQIYIDEDGTFMVGSRKRWLSAHSDHFGLYAWAMANREELMTLGPGRHFGEWWGHQIQRGYGIDEKRFSLFNIDRWSDFEVRPKCCDAVPVLAEFDKPPGRGELEILLRGLEGDGSYAAPGFMQPEGIVIYHTAGAHLYKLTIGDDGHKGEN